MLHFGAVGERLRETPLKVEHDGDVTSVAFGPDGKIAVGYHADVGGVRVGGVVLFNAKGVRLRLEPLEVNEGDVMSVVFGPDGKIAAGYNLGVKDADAGVVLFDAQGERIRKVLLKVSEGYVTSVAFGPEDRLAAGYRVDVSGGGVMLFSILGERLGGVLLDVKGGYVTSVAFGSKGNIALGYGVGGVGGVKLFNAKGERLVPAPLQVVDGDVRSVAIGPEGKIAAGYGRGVVVFDADPTSWRRKARQMVNRNLARLKWVRYFPRLLTGGRSDPGPGRMISRPLNVRRPRRSRTNNLRGATRHEPAPTIKSFF